MQQQQQQILQSGLIFVKQHYFIYAFGMPTMVVLFQYLSLSYAIKHFSTLTSHAHSAIDEKYTTTETYTRAAHSL